jgi:hypothetical protein
MATTATAKRMHPNEEAFRLLLAGDKAGLRRLAAKLRRANSNNLPCPACGSASDHDDNGERGPERMLCCADCGEHFDAEPDRF